MQRTVTNYCHLIMRRLFSIALLLVLALSCTKTKSRVDAGSSIEIYLLQSVIPVPAKCQISSGTLRPEPLVANDDIIEYNENDHEYRVTATAYEKIRSLKGRIPFAITVDKEVVYYGFYNEPILNSSCEHSIAMEAWNGDNVLTMELGYPGGFSTVDDQRNHPKLIETLRRQHKLK
ncbi:MAG TPA: hypothetical protein VM012_12955 [Flavitalea sp.]|nr:hypothetical protein [Flavitalea sp.]